jgi:hypothetical protein
VKDPVGVVLGCGKARHLSGPADLVREQLTRLVPDHVRETRMGVAVEDLGRPIDRTVVGGDEEINPERSVEAQVVLEQVLLVSNLERHHQFHLACNHRSTLRDR